MTAIKCSAKYNKDYGTTSGEFTINVNVDESDEDDVIALRLFTDRLEELFGNDFRFHLVDTEEE